MFLFKSSRRDATPFPDSILTVIAPCYTHSIIDDYAQRWGIETLFGIFKSRGFNLEDTLKGLPYKYSKYNPQTGLPKPSYENMRKRDRSLEYWKQDIAKLERDARGYCN